MPENELFNVAVSAWQNTPGVKLVVAPSELGLRAPKGCVILVMDDNTKVMARVLFRDPNAPQPEPRKRARKES